MEMQSKVCQRACVKPLLAWYERSKRDLPWRRQSHDPYAVWVSEIMLQQTQVDRVCDYFLRFMRRFPTVLDLSRAQEKTVLKHWEGLGYYRRARQLHAAAKEIVRNHDGKIPQTVESLCALPGIGRYTAGAIASIAFDIRAPIVEANSRRVIARLFGYDAPLDGRGGDKPIWDLAEQLVPVKKPGHFNQALMDLGATICTPERPICSKCPLKIKCTAFQTNRTDVIPLKPKPRLQKQLSETAIIFRQRNNVLVEQRGPGEWWDGLWDFPRGPRHALKRGRQVGVVSYTVTHHRVECAIREIFVSRPKKPTGRQRWVEIASLSKMAMTAPGRRIAAGLRKRRSQS